MWPQLGVEDRSMLGYEHGLRTQNVIACAMYQDLKPIRYFAVLTRRTGVDVLEYCAVVVMGAVLFDPRK